MLSIANQYVNKRKIKWFFPIRGLPWEKAY